MLDAINLFYTYSHLCGDIPYKKCGINQQTTENES